MCRSMIRSMCCRLDRPGWWCGWRGPGDEAVGLSGGDEGRGNGGGGEAV